jgi:CarD family transcriptional regulator
MVHRQYREPSTAKGDLSVQIGDAVLHPRYGVGIIGGIETRVQDGEKRDYYVIPKPSISSTIFVPIDSAEEVGLRLLASQDTLEEALEILQSGDGASQSSPGLRNLSWGDPLDLARVIRHQALEPKSRYPKVSEQQQLKRAKRLLAEELKVVLGLSEEAAAGLVESAPATDGTKVGRN